MNSTPTFAQVAAVEYAREETRSKAEELKRRLDIANDALADAEMRAEEAEAATEAYKHEMALEVEAEEGAGGDEGGGGGGGGGGAKDLAKDRARLAASLDAATARGDELAAALDLERNKTAWLEDELERAARGSEATASASASASASSASSAAAAEKERKKAETAALLSTSRGSGSSSAADVERLAKLASDGERARAVCAALEADLARSKEAAAKAKASLADATSALKAERDDGERTRERARALLEEKDVEIDALRRKLRGGGEESDATGDDAAPGGRSARAASATATTLSPEDFLYLRSVVLKFVETPSWDAQQSLLPVLAAVMKLAPDENRRMLASRAANEPTEVYVARAAPETANSLSEMMGLGKFF